MNRIRPASLRLRTVAIAAAFASLMAAPAAQAWDASVTLPSLGVDFGVSSWSGDWTWASTREGVSSTYGTDGNIPIDFQFQAWTGTQWDQAYFHNETLYPAGGSGAAYFDRFDTEMAIADYADAFVTGALGNASAGSIVAYDFVFTLNPFSEATLTYADDAALVSLGAGAGESGVAFAGLKLYDWTADLNVPGGANQAYFNAFGVLDTQAIPQRSPLADVEIGQTLTGMSYTFSNLTAAPVSYDLRLEGYALVFTTPVPEPAAPALLLAGLGVLGWVARRRGARAG
ncbi:MAG: PEP-CTERM sorting domain-containing protein [Burkholderiaceae bacterium]|nr:PEP-CTERM sorting domain-containing protein [Rhodoferax sp.]MCP5283405.1 PEP-CTERM sorting domain-containing protein [Burkholderiaceae bacterium]